MLIFFVTLFLCRDWRRFLTSSIICVKFPHPWSIKLIVLLIFKFFLSLHSFPVLLFNLFFYWLPNRFTFWRHIFFTLPPIILLLPFPYHYFFLMNRRLFHGYDCVCVHRLVSGLLGPELRLDLTVVDIVLRLEVHAWAPWEDHWPLIWLWLTKILLIG